MSNMNAEPGCGCRVFIEAEARWLDGLGGQHWRERADELRRIATRLPAPPPAPVEKQGGIADAELVRLREENANLLANFKAASAAAKSWALPYEQKVLRCDDLEREVTTLRAALAAAEGERDRLQAYAWDAQGALTGAWGMFQPQQWGRELWLAAWMVAAGGDYLSTEMWTNLLDGLADAERERDEARAMQAEWRDVAHQAIELSKRVGGAA